MAAYLDGVNAILGFSLTPHFDGGLTGSPGDTGKDLGGSWHPFGQCLADLDGQGLGLIFTDRSQWSIDDVSRSFFHLFISVCRSSVVPSRRPLTSKPSQWGSMGLGMALCLAKLVSGNWCLSTVKFTVTMPREKEDLDFFTGTTGGLLS